MFSCECKISFNEILEIQHHSTDRNLDLCAITEIWIKQDDKAILNTLSPNGYLIKSSPRCNQTGGGVAMMYISGLACYELQKYSFKAMEDIDYKLSTQGKFIPIAVTY